MINKQQILSDVDTVDHITVLPRWNKPFDRERAVRAIRHCRSYYGDVFAFDLADFTRLETATERELLEELVAIRETLLRHLF